MRHPRGCYPKGTYSSIPLRYINSVIFFGSINTLKVTVIILTVVILDFSTLSTTNLHILTPERYDEHIRYLYVGVFHSPLPPPPPSRDFSIYLVTSKELLDLSITIEGRSMENSPLGCSLSKQVILHQT